MKFWNFSNLPFSLIRSSYKTYASRVSEWRIHSPEMRQGRTPEGVRSESKRIFLGPVPVTNRQQPSIRQKIL